MATHHGKNGVVRVSSNAVAEITEWNLEEAIDTADDTVMGDTSKTHLIGIKEWSGSITCFWDETDTNGQEALSVGASVTLNLYPEGVGSGSTYKTGTATITRVTMNVVKDGVVTRAFQFQGNGAISQATV